MSRTYRRKNAWNAALHIEKEMVDDWFNQRVRHTKYHGCTEEQVYQKLKAAFYGETSPNWDGKKYAKEYTRWKLRCLNKMELIRALKTGQEENLLLTGYRQVTGLWWYWD